MNIVFNCPNLGMIFSWCGWSDGFLVIMPIGGDVLSCSLISVKYVPGSVFVDDDLKFWDKVNYCNKCTEQRKNKEGIKSWL